MAADSSDCDDILPGPYTNYGFNKLFNSMLFIASIFIYFESKIASKHHRLIGLDASKLLTKWNLIRNRKCIEMITNQ